MATHLCTGCKRSFGCKYRHLRTPDGDPVAIDPKRCCFSYIGDQNYAPFCCVKCFWEYKVKVQKYDDMYGAENSRIPNLQEEWFEESVMTV